MRRVKFIVPGVPRPWQRSRSKGKRHFDSPEQEKRKILIKHLATRAMRDAGLGVFEGPVRLTVICVFPRPNSRRWKSRGTAGERCSLEVWKDGDRFLMWARPDWDNLGKLPSDCIDTDKGSPLLGPILIDDGQVAIGHVEKWYAAKGEAPHTRVTVESLT